MKPEDELRMLKKAVHDFLTEHERDVFDCAIRGHKYSVTRNLKIIRKLINLTDYELKSDANDRPKY